MRLDLGALVQFQASLLLNPEAAEFSNLGQLYAIRGEFDEAVQAYRHSLRLRPNYAPVHARLAKILSRQGQTEQAMVHFKEAMRLDPNLPYCEVNFCQ
jgi:protein O-GlcNAc transferase